MRVKLPLGTALLAGSMVLASQVRANPIQPELWLEVFDNGTQIGSVVTSVTGSATLLTSDANFSSILVSANGIPSLPSPNLSSVALEATSASGLAASDTLTVLVSQTGVTTGGSPSGVASTFTANNLTAAHVSTTFATYIDGGDQAFAETTQIAGATLDGGSAAATAGPFITFILPTTFSETQEYDTTFTGALQSVSLTSQIVGVPEPVSIAVLGTGLAGIALIRRRKA